MRLIDADALLENTTEGEGWGGWIEQVVLVEDINNAPTIDISNLMNNNHADS